MHTNDSFRYALKTMNAACKEDYKSRAWKYTNTKKRASTFAKARTGNRLTNCVDAVQWGLKMAGVPSSALNWYGSKNGLTWCSTSAKSDAKKYFELKSYNGKKTVNQLYKKGELLPGDIITYIGMAHTNCYYSDGKSFDAGSSEGSTFKKWIFSLKWKSKKVATILRLKDRTRYRVQCGAFSDVGIMIEKETMLHTAGFETERITEDGYIKLQAGLFDYPQNANALMQKIQSAGFPAIIKEV